MVSRRSSSASLGWFDEHGPRATMQITPDGDYTQTGVAWNKFGYANPHCTSMSRPRSGPGLYYFHARTAKGTEFSFPWIVAPQRADRARCRAGIEHHLERLQQLRRPEQLHQPRSAAASPTVNARLELKRYTDPDNVTYDTDDYAPLSFERPEPINHIDAWRPRSTTRSKAGPPATSHRPSGGCWAGSNANTSPTTITPRPSFTTARSTSMRTRS